MSFNLNKEDTIYLDRVEDIEKEIKKETQMEVSCVSSIDYDLFHNEDYIEI